LCVDILLDVFDFFTAETIVSQATNTVNALVKRLLGEKHPTFRVLWAKGSRTISLFLNLIDRQSPKRSPLIRVERDGILWHIALPAVPLPSTVTIEIGNVVVNVKGFLYDDSSSSICNQSFEVF
jgi:hypothetical protein